MQQTTVSAGTNQTDGMTANEIIKTDEKSYVTANSYSDSGVVKIVFINSDRRRTVKKPFTTAFIRPDRFRFEYREKALINREFRFIVF